jgi:hypothetical protein
MNKLFILCILAVAVMAAKPKTFADCEKLRPKCKQCQKYETSNKACKKAVKAAKSKAACTAKVTCIKTVEKLKKKKDKKALKKLEDRYGKYCPTTRAQCGDRSPNCPTWANRNPSECTNNPTFMLANCAASCCPICTGRNTLQVTPGLCPSRPDLCSPNTHPSCHEWATGKNKECNKNRQWMRTYCMQSCCKNCKVDGNNCPVDRNNCKNSYKKPNKKKGQEACRAWAQNGECQSNFKWMNKNCARECCPICNAFEPAFGLPLPQPQPLFVGQQFGGYGAGLPYAGR